MDEISHRVNAWGQMGTPEVKDNEICLLAYFERANLTMKGDNRLTGLVLLVAIFGVLVLSAGDYVVCHNEFPDEFLDLAVVCQSSIVPVFSSPLNVNPYVLKFLRVSHLRKVNSATSTLRC